MDYEKHVRTVTVRLAGNLDELPVWLEDWITERIEDASSAEESDD